MRMLPRVRMRAGVRRTDSRAPALDPASLAFARVTASMLLGFQAGRDVACEEGMGLARAALELGVGLAADEPALLGELDHLHEHAVGGGATEHQTGFFERGTQRVVDLIAVAVALADKGVAVDARRAALLFEHAVVG